ncbi:transporter substrate-binding domain-containing protein [Candidatus Marithioploca araucensis]|uniref:Transporter substrate-binding domain-containing protein n=1 Tax=Candidatus Marithioploca araucensis TaxID=70273 RepID=A0ABT7VQU9_9GAMM|nr:transporter substrate-binding domain-containing protein [Candidatus Marithioploca araucensis]
MQLKKKLLLTAVGMACHLSAHAQSATFDVETQELHLPVVDVMLKDEQVGKFEVEMQLVPNTIVSDFTIKKITPITSSISTDGILGHITNRGSLACGMDNQLSTLQGGFVFINENGQIRGFDVDFCRAVAAAVLNNANVVAPVMVVPGNRQVALKPGNVDILTAITTWTSSRDASWGNFTWITLYDGQGFVVKKDSGITSIEQFEGATICVTGGTTTIVNLEEVFNQRGISFTPVVFSNDNQAFSAYEQGQCTAYTTDRSLLSVIIYKSDTPNAHLLLDETISKEPLAPSVPFGDEQWLKIVRTVIFGLINAEELGITQANVDTMMNSDNPEVKRLLGVEGSFGQAELGLETDAIARAVRAVGNYGEIYERNLGTGGIGIPRGLNKLWTDGGLIYAPPLR